MVRNASGRANNQDALVWALWLLGGADRDVDVEDIYIKCFEIAPARLGWRTRPEIPDYKKTSKALQSVESKELPGLLHRTHALRRRLTNAGVEWVARLELADAFQCSPGSPDEVWRGRFEAAMRSAEVLGDQELKGFVAAARASALEERSSSGD